MTAERLIPERADDTMTDFSDKYSVLRDFFGHTDFREGQLPLIDALLSGRDAVGIMPTGAGKSMCYQIPALMLDGNRSTYYHNKWNR